MQRRQFLHSSIAAVGLPLIAQDLAGDTGLLRAGTAYCIAYMRALFRRANDEVG